MILRTDIDKCTLSVTLVLETPVSWDQSPGTSSEEEFRGRVPRKSSEEGVQLRGAALGISWEQFPGRKSSEGIKATPWPKQTLQKAANGAYKGHRFATQSIQIPQNTAKTSETKNEGVWGGGNPTQKSHSICCKRTSSLAPPWPVS